MAVWTDYDSGKINVKKCDHVDRPLFKALMGEFEGRRCQIEIHYGPISTGLWEAGAFRIYTYGERILGVIPDLGYKRRKMEERIVGKDLDTATIFVERICGNFAISYATAFCSSFEDEIPERAMYIRAVALELERIYNHLRVMYRLANCASQKVAVSHLSALVEDILRLNAKLFGHRFCFGLIVPGGVSRDLNAEYLLRRLKELEKEFEGITDLLLSSRIFIDRLHRTAVLDKKDVVELDTIGVPARASGVSRDVRAFDPFYSELGFEPKLAEDGDALARMMVRVEEIRSSIKMIEEISKSLPDSELSWEQDANGFFFGRSEAPPGDVLIAVDVEDGIVKWIGIRPPSIVNYLAFSRAVVGNIFTDYPFALESFGLSFSDSDR